MGILMNQEILKEQMKIKADMEMDRLDDIWRLLESIKTDFAEIDDVEISTELYIAQEIISKARNTIYKTYID